MNIEWFPEVNAVDLFLQLKHWLRVITWEIILSVRCTVSFKILSDVHSCLYHVTSNEEEEIISSSVLELRWQRWCRDTLKSIKTVFIVWISKINIQFDEQKHWWLSSLLASVIFWKVWEHIWLIKPGDDKSLTHTLDL